MWVFEPLLSGVSFKLRRGFVVLIHEQHSGINNHAGPCPINNILEVNMPVIPLNSPLS